MAGVREAALHNGVVLGEVAEGKGVAEGSFDIFRVEAEFCISADGNVDVGCK